MYKILYFMKSVNQVNIGTIKINKDCEILDVYYRVYCCNHGCVSNRELFDKTVLINFW